MKFWQLLSIMRGELNILRELASKQAQWKYILEWISDEDRILRSQDRAKLDHILPLEYVRAALKRSNLAFYLSKGHILRSRRQSYFDKKLSALEAFDRFGANALEEALEYGSTTV